ncbi:hypothetical protein BGZ94_007788 [Podila epigama]|nr:hypothetical protein BGZ94_007788 [Podila epigama]
MLVNMVTLTFACLAVVFITTLTTATSTSTGQIVHISSQSDWCMMLPPRPGKDIAENEHGAIAFCTTNKGNINDTRTLHFPKGFIRSAHFYTHGDDYVQVTGRIDRSKYNLGKHDQGGQYDAKAPRHSSCAGYSSYVNLIEPHRNTFCIRCCNEDKYCDTSKSTYGCDIVIQGDYSYSKDHDDGSSSTASPPLTHPTHPTHPNTQSDPIGEPNDNTSVASRVSYMSIIITAISVAVVILLTF